MSDTYYTDVVLLTHADGTDASTTFTDVSQYARTLTAVGNAQVDTAQFKFGTASALFDGTGDAITTPDATTLRLGVEDFTIELWARPATVAGGVEYDLLAKRASTATTGSWMIFQFNAALQFYMSSTGTSNDIANAQTIGTAATGSFQHIAITRQGTTFRAYFNGVQGSTWSSAASVFADATALSIGAAANGTGSYNGWIDEVRITKGVARYTGSGSFTPPISAFDSSGIATAGAGAFATMTELSGAPGAAPSFSAMTAAARAAVAAAGLFEATTAEGTSLPGTVGAADQFTAFLAAEASAVGTAASVASGDASFEEMVAFAHNPQSTDIAFEPMAASAVGLTGTIASGLAQFLVQRVSGTSTAGGLSRGAARFAYVTARAVGTGPRVATGAVAFERSQGRVSAVVGTVARGTSVFKAMTAAVVGYAPSVATGYARFQPLFVTGISEVTGDGTFRGWAMNTRHSAVTEYTSFPYNSLARYNGGYLAAGPSGLVLLAGEDDAGEDIEWLVRTGQLDDKTPALKRMTELLLGVRYDGPVSVRVYPRDSVSYEYSLANYVPNFDLHQARVKLGKGLQSRYYKVEVSGSGTKFELDSMQVTMPQTARRIG